MALKTLPGDMGHIARESRWPFVELLAGSLVGMVDLALAGHLPLSITPSATAAVGVAGYLGWLMLLLVQSLGVAAMARLSRLIGSGAGLPEKQSVVTAALNSGLVWGTVLGICQWLLAPHAASILSTDPETAGMLAGYLRITAWFLPFLAYNQIAASLFRARGDMRTPFLLAALTNVVNATASILLVQVFSARGGGFIGIPLGTGVAWGLGSTAAAFALHRKHLPARNSAWTAEIRPLLKLALPAMAEFLWVWAGQMVVMGWVAANLARTQVAAHSLATRITGFTLLPVMALGLTLAPTAGRLAAARGLDRARSMIAATGLLGIGLGGLSGLLLATLGLRLTGLMGKDPAVNAQAASLLGIIAWTQAAYAFYAISTRAAQGLGATRLSMTLNAFTILGIQLPGVWLFGSVMGWGLYGVWAAFTCERVVNALLFAGWLILPQMWRKRPHRPGRWESFQSRLKWMMRSNRSIT